jgi:hypothetical protein
MIHFGFQPVYALSVSSALLILDDAFLQAAHPDYNLKIEVIGIQNRLPSPCHQGC